MTDAEQIARGVLDELQEATTAKDLDRLTDLLADDAVVFGTAAANVDRAQASDYLASVLAQPGTVRWTWDLVLPLVSSPDVLVFAVLGTVGIDGEADAVRYDFRLTCVAEPHEDRWRLLHFHGSVPQTG